MNIIVLNSGSNGNAVYVESSKSGSAMLLHLKPIPIKERVSIVFVAYGHVEASLNFFGMGILESPSDMPSAEVFNYAKQNHSGTMEVTWKSD